MDNFKNDYKKDSDTKDVFRKRRNTKRVKELSKENRERWINWVTFYRRNIFMFIIDVMDVELFPFQILWIYLMQISPFFVGICSRTASKSFLVAVFTVARSILYPGLETIVVATTKEQAGRILKSKVQYLYDNSAVCQSEIKSLTTNLNNYECVFHCGSRILVVAGNEGALGNRCNDLILDEFAQMDKEIVDNILKPFLYPRQTPYSRKEKYIDLIEPVRIYYISSAWYASEWWYKTALFAAHSMITDGGAGFFCTDYLTTLRHNLKTVEQIEDEKKNNASFDMQYGNIPSRDNKETYFPISMFKRDIQKAFYPMRRQDYPLKKNPHAIARIEGEVRIMGVDLATRAAKANDNSVVCCVRLLPSKKGYKRNLVYMESSHGANHTIQANRIKDIWYDFNADYICMDITNIGMSVYEDLGLPYFNEERGLQISPFTVMDIPEIDEKVRVELREKTMGANPIANIFPISGTPTLNTDIHVAFRSALQKKLWSFLVDDINAEDFLIRSNKEYVELLNKDENLKSFMLHPHVQVSFFITEATNLKMVLVNNNIKLVEGSGTKDRYSSVSYANHLCSIFDKDLLREEEDDDDWSILSGLMQVY
jgi:hypothetical protein